MIRTNTTFKNRVLAFGAVIAMSASALPVVAGAQSTHRGLLHRHPHLATAGAGIGAYELAKRTGRNRAAAGGHRNFAQRHPFLTGAAAAGITHHYAKKHR